MCSSSFGTLSGVGRCLFFVNWWSRTVYVPSSQSDGMLELLEKWELAAALQRHLPLVTCCCLVCCVHVCMRTE